MDPEGITSLPKISVIVASFNSGSQSYLKRCLESIKNQDYNGEIEIIVVDGGSTDDSIAISNSLGARVIYNQRITELGFNGGKNLGVSYSTGKFIAMIDADNILMDNKYFTNMITPFLENPEITMTIPTPYLPVTKECTVVCRYFCLLEQKLWESLTATGVPKGTWIKFRPANIVVSNGAIIRRSVLESIGGWDYDTEVGFRLIENGFGCFGMVYSAKRFHIEMLQFRDIWRKFRRRILNQIEEKKNKKVSQRIIYGELKNPFIFLNRELLIPIKSISLRHKKYFPVVLIVFFIKIVLGLYYILNLSLIK